MAKVRCDYCWEYCDEEFMETLDKGSPACPQCVAKEDAEKERKYKENQKKEG